MQSHKITAFVDIGAKFLFKYKISNLYKCNWSAIQKKLNTKRVQKIVAKKKNRKQNKTYRLHVVNVIDIDKKIQLIIMVNALIQGQISKYRIRSEKNALISHR